MRAIFYQIKIERSVWAIALKENKGDRLRFYFNIDKLELLTY
ncbi:hypothetical protein [Microcoleus sp. ARI1-A2]